jgi:hypothetical protein
MSGIIYHYKGAEGAVNIKMLILSVATLLYV